MAETTYPIGYGRQEVTLDELIRREFQHMEPEAKRRHLNLIVARNGALGVGDGWRATPSGTSPASLRGESFHQTQTFRDGTKWFTALDYVVRRPNSTHTSMIPPGLLPVQGTAEAAVWGIHANVGTPGRRGWESWHGQPIEHDGQRTWVNDGRHRPVAGYPIPAFYPSPAPQPVPTSLGYQRIAIMGTFEAASATRWDTRGFGAPLKAGEYNCKLDGSAGKLGATVNITIVGGASAGFASAWAGGPRPDTSKVNYLERGATANECFVPLALDGSFMIFISTPAHMIVDLVGYWS